MTIEQFLESVKGRKKGTYIKIVWKKSLDEFTQKFSSGVFRLGVNYQNTKTTLEKAKNGENKQTRTYSDEIIIPNLLYKNKKGEHKIRVFITHNNRMKTKTKFERNGKEIDKQTLIEEGLLKDNKHIIEECFNIMLDNVISIGV